MAEVPDHLVPTDGLTNSLIKYGGLDTLPSGGGAIHRFDIYNEERKFVASFEIETGPTGRGSVDGMIAEAHRRMVDVLRQWLHLTEEMRQAYENSAAR